jgi:hypothetical protein
MAGNEVPGGGGDVEWVEFQFVKGIFVEAEEVDIAEVAFDWRGEGYFGIFIGRWSWELRM